MKSQMAFLSMTRTMNPHNLRYCASRRRHQGIVLPMALIMLVIISFAGLLAARNSATYEQFSNNMRTNQVARQTAEEALRYCEQVAIDSVEGTGNTLATDIAKIIATRVTNTDVASINGGSWNTRTNWAATNVANLITVNLTASGLADTRSTIRNNPSCIIQPVGDDSFLVTSRGLSNDAVVNTTGTLTNGSEVWMQSILTPGVPVRFNLGGGNT